MFCLSVFLAVNYESDSKYVEYALERDLLLLHLLVDRERCLGSYLQFV